MAKKEGAYKLLTQLPVLYLIPREGDGVDAGVGRAYGVRDFSGNYVSTSNLRIIDMILK